MDENTLLKISLISCLVGILILLYMGENSKVNLSDISTILEEKNIDKTVKIQGTLNRVTKTPEVIITNIQDETGNIPIIIFTNNETKILDFFTPNKKEIDLEKGMRVEITGKVIEYKGQLEISADEIRRI
jgi:DNA/RNA endonuclease YhcR with UshA esterase domain